jgi:hypothetical protein
MSISLLTNYVFEEPPPRLHPLPDDGPPRPRPITEAALAEAAGESPPNFPLVHLSQCTGVRLAFDFVERLLTEAGASVAFGPSNTGKTFVILDLTACVATGRAFRGLEVDQGAVVYVALEGDAGAQNRVEALRREGKLSDTDPFFFVFAPVNLMKADHAGMLAASIRQAAATAELPVRLVVIDTLARAMSGGDENAGRDMSMAVESIDAVRATTGAHVLCVHHSGKDETRGARGHSSLRAAIDTELELSRAEGSDVSVLRVVKQRDLPIGPPMPFRLKTVTLGIDRRGKPVTSCVVEHLDESHAPQKPRTGRKRAVSNEELLALLPQDSTAEWLKAATGETGISKTSFYDQLRELKKGKIRKSTGGAWIPDYSPNKSP